MKTIDDLKNFYEVSLMPHLRELEKLRKEQLARLRFIAIAVITSISLGIVLMIPTLIIIFLLISLVLYFVAYGFNRKRPDFKRSYKETVIKKLIEFMEPGLAYSPYQFIAQTRYSYSQIFLQSPDIYSGEDLVQGMIDKTMIEFCELHTQDRQTDSKGRTTYVTIFKGIFFIADFNKNFSGKTFVLSDFGERFFGAFGKWLQSMSIARPDVVRLEDTEFEKYFAVYSTNQVEARYILSTSLMQRLVEFRKKTNANIQMSFLDSNIYFAVPYRYNLFDPSLRKSVLNFDEVQEFYNQIIFCTSIVDELNLNTRIWSKQ